MDLWSGDRPWRRGRIVAVLVLLAVAGPTGSSAGAETDPTLGGFLGTASAQGGRASFAVPGFIVVDEIADAGGPVSQSLVDTLGALSFASMPYPGDLVISGPGLFAGFTGQSLPGGYPLYVSASHPVAPEQSFADPTGSYQLLARAAAGTASSAARVQGQGREGASGASTGARAVTCVLVDDDTITVTAETVNEALDFGAGALRIASVRSTSVTTYRAGQPRPVTKTELIVDGGSAGGTRFGFGPDGLVVADQGVPIPRASALEQLNAVLAPAGVSLRFAGARELAGGASADVLEISVAGQAPVPGLPPGILRVRLGGATSAVVIGEGAGGLIPPVDGAVGEGDEVFAPPAASDDTTTGGLGGGVTSPGSLPADLTGGPFTTGGLDAVAAGGGGSGSAGRFGSEAASRPDSASPAAGSSGAGLPSAAGEAQPIFQPRRLDSHGLIYGVLIAAAVVMLAVSSLWRGKGVLSV